MSVLSDKAIASLSQGPDFVYNVTERVDVDSNGVETHRVIKTIGNGVGPLIEPFIGESINKNEAGQKILSYGLSSYGYDVRIQPNVELFTNINNSIIDPMNPDKGCFVKAEIRTNESGLRYFVIPPNSYALAHTVEYFKLPKDILIICLGKSTYARAGIIINTTPIEPGFEGEVVIEISNSTPLPAKIYIDGGIAQFIFFNGIEECDVGYGDRNGKYQGQRGITHAKV